MSKLFALVVVLNISVFSSVCFAADTSNLLSFQTKDIVRMKLWYEGLDNLEKTQENQDVEKEVKLSEGLRRAIDKFDL